MLYFAARLVYDPVSWLQGIACLANSTVVVPLLDSRRDRHALRTLTRIFPKRRVIGVQAREILLGGGNIHCITQQVPADK